MSGRAGLAPGRLLARLWLSAAASAAVLVGARRRALELYAEIVELDPEHLASRATLGNMLMERGDSAAAVAQFERLLQSHPEHADSWFNLGFIHDQRDELPAAERCFRRALALNDQHDRAWYGLGLVLIRQLRLAEAAEALKRNIKLQPFSPYGYYQLAMTQQQLGDSGEAWRVYEQLKGFEPRYAATLKRDLELAAARAPRAADATPTSTLPPTPTAKEILSAAT